MNPTKDKNHELTVSVRTEEGRTSIDLGLDDFTPQERHFIFSGVASTHKGGEAGFGMETLEDGRLVIQIVITGPNLRKSANKAVKEALN